MFCCLCCHWVGVPINTTQLEMEHWTLIAGNCSSPIYHECFPPAPWRRMFLWWRGYAIEFGDTAHDILFGTRNVVDFVPGEFFLVRKYSTCRSWFWGKRERVQCWRVSMVISGCVCFLQPCLPAAYSTIHEILTPNWCVSYLGVGFTTVFPFFGEPPKVPQVCHLALVVLATGNTQD